MPEPAARSPKAEQTRASIAEAAMRLFRRDGYDKTTMRAIAREAGVSVGNAYYYFASKEHLIQAFYDSIQAEHAAAASTLLAGQRSFAARLHAVLETWLQVAAPDHEFAGQFFRNAAEPTSPLSPFSPESARAREASIAVMAQVVDGSDLKLAPALRRELPELLWMVQMGVVLFWVYDDSAGQARSHALVDKVVPMLDRLARLSRLPVVRGLVDDLLDLMTTLRSV
ncbi:TetR family transcriptional regulator [Nocardioides sp. 503]|uniref:TetR/AcrR family transcriptional regulator n=1 Tax=Nocardioides sp. 503 TaxID=2508326 RepID=UPI001FD69F5A|nr:TetR family transcriptional regulator [Nocardioides sp. 503]